MKKAVIYIHGKGGNPGEAEHYQSLFPDCDVIGFDYRADTPWDAESEFPAVYDSITRNYDHVCIVANSIGAYFAMTALADKPIKRAYFISPVVNMEKLITDMMSWAGVSEEELSEKKEIGTSFGETLSWKYLVYAREHPLQWTVPTYILYGEKDHLISYETVSAFAEKFGATLDIMQGGEHWFHTEEEVRFLDAWIIR